LDADLILLSMISHNSQNTFLLRENTNFEKLTNLRDPYLLLNVGRLAALIHQEMTFLINNNELTSVQSISDYTILMSLLGNDFIPPLSFLKIKDNGIHVLLQTYSKVVDATNQYLVQGSSINHVFLTKLFGELSTLEDAYMNDVVTQYYARKPPHLQNKTDMFDYYPLMNKFKNVIDPSQKGWRMSYYHYLFEADQNDANKIVNQACSQYIQTLHWIHDYYFRYEQNELWHYPYAYSPCILDLYNYSIVQDGAANHEHTRSEAMHDIILDPILQLLIVLPPQNAHLLPVPFQSIMRDLEKGCVHFYPYEFTLHTFLKHYLWECHVKLPSIDLKRLYNTYRSIKL
jgi:5'-3' exonuclease